MGTQPKLGVETKQSISLTEGGYAVIKVQFNAPPSPTGLHRPY